MNENTSYLAKLVWTHPQTGLAQEFVLFEGATITIGRASNNDIHIPEQHVSRQHAMVTYQDGVFMISDMGSANGTFVNDQQITEPFPLFSGDIVRLYVPTLTFSAPNDAPMEDSSVNLPVVTAPLPASDDHVLGRLIIANGEQEGEEILLRLPYITIGRATSSATWEVALRDPSVSRPHACLERVGTVWVVKDLGSSNGTSVNETPVSEKGRVLRDGDTITFGNAKVRFLL